MTHAQCGFGARELATHSVWRGIYIFEGEDALLTSVSARLPMPPPPTHVPDNAVFVGAVLLAAFVYFRAVETMGSFVWRDSWLQLTVWTHGIVAAFLLVAWRMPSGTAYALGLAVFALSIFVCIGRVIFFNNPRLSKFDLAQDVLTHFVVPAIMVTWFVSTKPPAPPRLGSSAMCLVNVALLWFTFNVTFLNVRGLWVYRSVGNPATGPGRIHLLVMSLVMFSIWLTVAFVARRRFGAAI